jgi:copper transport protein
VPLVGLLLVSGTIVSIVQLGSPGALLSTAYGRLLTAKLALVALLLGLAAVNRLWLTPAVVAGRAAAAGRLARTAAAEVALAAAILVLAAGFRLTPPPRALATAAPVAVHLHGAEAMADLAIRPGRAGANTVEITVFDGEFAPLQPREVSIAFAVPDRGIEPVRAAAELGEDGIWRAGPVTLPMAGGWEITLRLLIDDFESRAIGGKVALSP